MLVEGPWSVALWFVVPGGRPRQSSLGGGACGRMAVQSSLWGQQHACSGLYPPSDTQRGLSPLRLAAAWLQTSCTLAENQKKKAPSSPSGLTAHLEPGLLLQI